ncbi:c-type cytochrome [Pirellulales bacterium]|nr:c-type cytochrome [Pirellulales bacterium]
MKHDYQRLWLACLLFGSWSFLLTFLATAERASAADPQHPKEKKKADGHWGEDAVGFRWVEDDSRDARWNNMDTGPFMTSALDVPTAEGASAVVNKALSIRLGDQQHAAICFDLERMTVRCGWTGGFLKYDPTRFGLISRPTIAGKNVFTAPDGQGWGKDNVEYRGLHLRGSRVVISYAVNGTGVLESYWATPSAESPAIVRHLEVEPRSKPITVVVADASTPIAVRGDVKYSKLDQEENQPIRLQILPCSEPVRLQIWLGSVDAIARASDDSANAIALSTWTKPGPGRWGSPLVTHGVVGGHDSGGGEAAYVIDSVELPFENRYNALLFLSGHDFFSDPGKMAVCTVHGDVWLVDGVDDTLDRVEWQRFATGLFQPLGLRIVDDLVYVAGRDQITRLRDFNNDGEADFYESFNNDAKTSPHGHDYSACLQTDTDGNFYYISEKGVHRISKDGSRYETIATGMRNPNGLAVAADGTITAAPQEGEWTPASALVEITPGGYYGFGGPRKTAERPLGYDPPLCWIPRLVDNSTGGQVWVPSDAWGPLKGQLLNLSFGQCRLLLTLVEPRTWSIPQHWPVLGEVKQASVRPGVIPAAARYVQGGSFSLPLDFQSGIMRGRFSPHDGQLYLSGLRGWLTTAAQDGCLQRVRYTGKAVTYPTAIRTLANGLAISFAISLDKENAENPGNYQLQRWNYRYSQNYGSPDYKISDPHLEGADDVEVLSATLLDEKTVFLETADVEPAMQLAIRYVLRGSDGQPIRNVYHHTINSAFDVRLDPARLTRRPRTDQLADELKKHLQNGLLWRIVQTKQLGGGQDVRRWRGASLYVPAGEPVTPFLQPGPFRAIAEGYLHIPLPGRYTFSVAGRGAVRLRINHEDVLIGEGDNLAKTWRRTVALKGGYNSLEMEYRALSEGDASLRVLWSADEFVSEPLPPASLWHDSRNKSLVSTQQVRAGRSLFAELRCIRCHAEARGGNITELRMPDLALDAPNLTGVGDRLREEWIARWHLDPSSRHSKASMPSFFDASDASRQDAIDVAAYLMTQASGEKRQTDASEKSIDRESLVEQGEILFEELGCLVCHSLNSADEPNEFDRLSLASVKQKYQPGALWRFLRKPHHNYQSSRMPDFKLTEAEASELVAFLEEAIPSSAETSAERPKPGDSERGQRIYSRKGCGACHQLDRSPPSTLPKAPAIFGRPSSRGCLDHLVDSRHDGPHYKLTENERDSVRAFLKEGNESLASFTAAEAADRLVERYACLSCHDRDGHAAQRPILIAEEGRGLAPDPVPNLTWTGEKLQAKWTAEFLAGSRDRSLRPWTKSRMPCFPQFAETIATGFAHQHGISTATPEAPEYDAKLAEIGRELTLQTALDCRQCHGIGELMPRGDERTKLAPGINFAIVRDRMHYDSYRRFVLDPPRFDLSVKMPKLVNDGKTTAMTRYFGGDAEQQFDAIWHYLQHFDKLRAIDP